MDDPRKHLFIDWLCTPIDAREPGNQLEFAKVIGTSPQLLTNWKKEKDFLAEWEAQYRRTVGSPEKAQAVLTALYRTATDAEDPRQVPAARAYLDAIDAIKPQKIDVTINKGAAKDLSDDELIAAMAEHAAREFEKRQSTIIDAPTPEVVDYSGPVDKE